MIQQAAALLEQAGIPRPPWTAEQLLAHRIGCQPVELYSERRPVQPDQQAWFESDVAARAAGVPLQYLMGTAEFYGREFFVGPGVFIPRPETEVLVEAVLELLAVRAEFVEARTPFTLRQAQGERLSVLDVGTGSGAIAITLALEKPGLKVTATDRSATALLFTEKNARRHGAAVELIQADLTGDQPAGSVDLLISNPPYLNPAEAGQWPKELAWEPWLALDGGPEGMAVLQRLLVEGKKLLKSGGWMALEVGMGQAQKVKGTGLELGYSEVRVVRDLAGIERVVMLKRGQFGTRYLTPFAGV